MWAYEGTIYQIYPLGFCGAPRQSDGVLTHRLLKVKDYIAHLKKLGVGAVLFKCAVEETGIPWQSERGPKMLMTLRLVKTYPADKMTRERMRDFDVVNVRGPRFMPEAMIRELEKV